MFLYIVYINMYSRFSKYLVVVFSLLIGVAFFLSVHPKVEAYQYYKFDIDPIPCGCRKELQDVYSQIRDKDNVAHSCVTSYEEFLVDPSHRHFWVEDPEITAQGKADERARQFIYWVLNKNAIDDHPAIRAIWNFTRNIAYFFVVILAVVIGMGFIIGQRTNFEIKIKVWPAIWKILLALLYITFSATLVLLMIQLSELLMRFFIDTLGGKDLFNIYFSNNSSNEKSYTEFIGCRDINIRSQEGANTEIMMLKLTNITYYVMGSMILLRKILLWFLLFVSPFLAILMPFVFIRNIGWIWIGVFFQWLFYGPLFALFLAALSKIWKSGIPFTFDFSRVNNFTTGGYVYPTAINILYGGPAQKLQILNNGNYVDTFVEYVITLLMLWAVTFFPWWLLRIFRDYCCEILAGMNNVLVSMYDQLRTSFPPAPPIMPVTPTATTIKTGTARPLQEPVDQFKPTAIDRRGGSERTIPVRIETIEEIKRAKTEQIVQSLNISATKLTDIARYETNNNMKESVTKNIQYLTNPVKAETPAERQKYMNIRTELFSRAIKEDTIARAILSSTSTSQIEQIRKKEEILKSTPQQQPAIDVISKNTSIEKNKITSVTSTYMNTIANNSSMVNTISQRTQLPAQQVQTILTTYSQNINQPTTQVINNISKQTHISKEKVRDVLKQTNVMTQQSSTINQIANTQQISNETIQKILQTLPVEATSQSTSISVSKVSTNEAVINNISQTTQIPQQQVQSILNTYNQNISQPVTQNVAEISKQTQISQEKVTEVIRRAAEQTESAQQISNLATSQTNVSHVDNKQAITKVISYSTNMTEQKASTITNTLLKSIASNESVIENVQQQTGVDKTKIKSILTSYSQNMNQPVSVMTENISRTSGVEKEKVNQVLKQVVKTVNSDFLASKDVIKDVAQKENIKVEEVQKVVDAQVPVVAEPEKHIEKTIAIPASISIEDYEEVKKMWTQQYEKGEVPVQENIASREEWVDQDIILITNTLNKMLAPDETLRREGLDDLGFILPIFMINNIKGEELLVYLKAKLEAAKAVKTEIEKEKELKEKLKNNTEDEDDLVELKKTKKEEQNKELHMEVEEPDHEGKKADSKELTDDVPSEPGQPTDNQSKDPSLINNFDDGID